MIGENVLLLFLLLWLLLCLLWLLLLVVVVMMMLMMMMIKWTKGLINQQRQKLKDAPAGFEPAHFRLRIGRLHQKTRGLLRWRKYFWDNIFEWANIADTPVVIFFGSDSILESIASFLMKLRQLLKLTTVSSTTFPSFLLLLDSIEIQL